MRIVIAAVIAVVAASSLPASADLFKCVGKDGKVAYQSDPCADASAEKRIKAPIADSVERGPGGTGLIDVSQAASRIRNRQGRATVVMLYSTTCSLSQRVFPEFVAVANQYRARGIDFVVLSTDDAEHFGDVPAFLSKRKAPFEPVAIKPWASGSLKSSLSSVGIEIAMDWTRPLIAVRDRSGKVVRKTEGVTDLGGLRATLDKLAL